MLSSLNPFSWWRTAKYIQRQRPDVIAIDWWHPFFGPCNRFLTGFLPKALRRKVIFITENVISHEANKVDKMLTRFGLKNANGFLALSASVEQHLDTLFHKKVFRSALPIYDFYGAGHGESSAEAKAAFGLKPGDRVFLFFGLIRKYKGLDLLLEAFALLCREYQDIKLLVAGDFYEPSGPYFDLIREFHLEKVVLMENRYIPNEEVARYFQAGDVVVLPYRSATQSGILSMAYGFRKPVVVTPVGELGALVEEGKTGIVVPGPTVEAIADGLSAYLELQASGEPFEQNIEAYLERTDEFKKINGVFGKIVDHCRAKGQE